MPEAWPSMRSTARCVLPVLVGPSTATTRDGACPEGRSLMHPDLGEDSDAGNMDRWRQARGDGTMRIGTLLLAAALAAGFTATVTGPPARAAGGLEDCAFAPDGGDTVQ